MSNRSRFVVLVDGKWQGGSFASEKDAKAAGATIKRGKVEIVPKSALPKAPPKEEAAAEEPAPEQKAERKSKPKAEQKPDADGEPKPKDAPPTP